jgi:hypothetical protein
VWWRAGCASERQECNIALARGHRPKSHGVFSLVPHPPTTFRVPHGKISADYDVATTPLSFGGDSMIQCIWLTCSSGDSHHLCAATCLPSMTLTPTNDATHVWSDIDDFCKASFGEVSGLLLACSSQAHESCESVQHGARGMSLILHALCTNRRQNLGSHVPGNDFGKYDQGDYWSDRHGMVPRAPHVIPVGNLVT